MQGHALRRQLVTREQIEVFDYWASLCDGGQHPDRQALDPSILRKHLPFVSILQRGANGRFGVRLAGTGFWNFHGEEIQGRALDDLAIGEGCAYWHRVLDEVCRNDAPLSGATRPFTAVGSGLQQFWLRLPLADGGRDTVLGFDQFMKLPAKQNAAQPSPLMRPVFGEGTSLLAAL